MKIRHKAVRLKSQDFGRRVSGNSTGSDSNIPASTGLFAALRIFFILTFPLALFFSYHPVISLGASETMNFELSLAEIWLALFGLLNLLDFKILRFTLWYYGRRTLVFFLFPAYALLSALWSPNHLRAVLTAGMLFLVVLDALSLYLVLHYGEKLRNLCKKVLLLSAAAVSVFCLAQCVLDLLGVSRDATLLCAGCTYTAFGFPHPNGFAIEPQFMGNLLIVPALLAVYLVVKKDRLFRPWVQTLLAVFLPFTLFLTFSRGAIYAFLLGVAIILAMQFPVMKQSGKKSREAKRALLYLPFILGALALSLGAQGLFAALSPTSDDFGSGVAKAVHQLTLGKIDFRSQQTSNALSDLDFVTTSEVVALDASQSSSTFSGYVAESTDIRVSLTNRALSIWNDSWTNFLFGTGLGSAGLKMYEKYLELGSPKEIVQNEYASLLLETGLLGFLLAGGTVLYIFVAVRRDNRGNSLLLGVLVAFGATLFFFSGLPNALHIYLFPLLLSQPPVRRTGAHQKHQFPLRTQRQ